MKKPIIDPIKEFEASAPSEDDYLWTDEVAHMPPRMDEPPELPEPNILVKLAAWLFMGFCGLLGLCFALLMFVGSFIMYIAVPFVVLLILLRAIGWI